MADFEIARAVGRCAVSGRTLNEGEAFYSVILDTPDGLQREDVSEECWNGPPAGAFCHFKSRIPRKEEPKKIFVDDDALVGFFLQLGRSEDPLKQRFRFVLSLMLMRKRLLKYEATVRDGGRESWRMKLVKDKSLHDVLDPALDERQIQELTGELGILLAGHTREAALAAADPGEIDRADEPSKPETASTDDPAAVE